MLRWGLVPSWAKDPSIGVRMINARAETIAEKPSFRSAFKHRRCLIPTDGYYEWAKAGKKKQPYFIRMKDRQPFAMAGLWESWKSPEGETIETFTIITCEANSMMKPFHHRMPVILDEELWGEWLDPENNDVDRLKGYLVPYDSSKMEAFPVSPLVNNPRNDSPQCVFEFP